MRRRKHDTDKPIKVFICDDEILTCNGIRDYFDWTGFGAVVIGTGKNGNEALGHFLKKGPFDLLITDIRMPGMDGLDLVSKLSSLSETLRVIMISAYDDFEYARKAVKFHIVDDYILKPIIPEDLRKSIVNSIQTIRQMKKKISSPPLRPKGSEKWVRPTGTAQKKPGKELSFLIASAADIIADRYLSANFNLQTLAKELSVSPNYLSAKFKEEVGVVFSFYLNSIRMNKAKDLLGHSYYKVYEIANIIGVNDAKYFDRLFKEYVGVTPKEYRDAVRAGENPNTDKIPILPLASSPKKGREPVD
jgi:two-component system response regulator YesN